MKNLLKKYKLYTEDISLYRVRDMERAALFIVAYERDGLWGLKPRFGKVIYRSGRVQHIPLSFVYFLDSYYNFFVEEGWDVVRGAAE